MGTASDLELLRDRVAIEELKYRYLRCLDLKDWAGLESCFHPQASVAYADGRLSFSGREAIVEFLRSVLGTTRRISVHRCHHPEIAFHSATRASGVWALDDWVYDLDSGTALHGAAYYEDEYVKEGGQWLILATGYRRVFEQTWSERDLPSLVRQVSWWGKNPS